MKRIVASLFGLATFVSWASHRLNSHFLTAKKALFIAKAAYGYWQIHFYRPNCSHQSNVCTRKFLTL
ncbi:hypothetical protein [Siphonobacter sp. BAB-5405]|uniref:hypothetical protein n=1 Tax=Siphonobacter sp. BAB-5405 TaxID=1864825 RepID=UPI0011AEEB7E|nr:hypothetical protein [Siphonobacter sp. BAB-5405]